MSSSRSHAESALDADDLRFQLDNCEADSASAAMAKALHEHDPDQRYRVTIEDVAIAELRLGISLRSSGLDSAHVANLCKAMWPLTPVLVHRPSMHVVDGHHRVAAATAQGMVVIRAWLFNGPLDVAYTLAVSANISHGLPLSMTDRRAAAQQMLVHHNDWSDRAIAASTGLSAKVVSRLRRASADLQQSNTRIGRDGRRRPVDAAAQRARAADILASHPTASLRQVARAVGLSPSTIHNMRARLEQARSSLGNNAVETATASLHWDAKAKSNLGSNDAISIMATLSRDPALRFNDAGRDLLQWLHCHVVSPDDGLRFANAVPRHSLTHLVALARQCSCNWSAIAETLAAQQCVNVDPPGRDVAAS